MVAHLAGSLSSISSTAIHRTSPLQLTSRRLCPTSIRLQYKGLPITVSRSVLSNRHFRPATSAMATDSAKSYSALDTGEDLSKDYGDDTKGSPTNRRAGIILHPTSLPGPYGTGEIGKEAFKFVDWLQQAGMQCWQVLPLVPPEEQFWSPYSGLDALCGHTLLIAIDELLEDGLLKPSEAPKTVPVGSADFAAVQEAKGAALTTAADRLLNDTQFKDLKGQMDAWRQRHEWVEDSALFSCLTQHDESLKDTAWWTWPDPIKFREPAALKQAVETHKVDIDRFIALQFLFDRQWAAVKAYANGKGVKIIGDMPIYVGGQSADVWAYPGLFELGPDGSPANVSGVPPDAFSETGQLWGSPLYDWKAQKADGFKWWARRLGRHFQLYDETRIDHFRGFAGYWSVSAEEETAMVGVWKKGPGRELFDALERELGEVPIIAEDLGVITPDVVELRKSIDAPGMVVLQFAFGGGSSNVHLPHNHYENSYCYPGTHDNETTVGFFKDSANKEEIAYLREYLQTDSKDIAGALIREAFKSVSRTSIFMMQDIMRLDNTARMNFPGTTEGNWAWRIGDSEVWDKLDKEAKELYSLAKTYDRLPPKAA